MVLRRYYIKKGASRNWRKILPVLAFLGLMLIAPSPSYADCTSPASPAGRIEFFSSTGDRVHKYCDGDNWLPWAGRILSGIPAPQFTSAGGITTLPELLDVDDAMSPAEGQIFMYSAGQWTAAPNSGGAGGGLWSQGAGDKIYYNSGASPMVGIGTTAPTAELHVVGDINLTGGINDISDIRLKENIAPVEGALEQIMQLEAIAFTMKDDPGARIEYGFSAQQMLEIYPALVRTADDEMNTLSLNYIGLIAPMTRAMQQQQAQIQAQKAQIEAQQARNQDQQARIDNLQARLTAMESRYGSPLQQQQDEEQ